MSTTVLEALQNAELNFKTVGSMGAKNNLIYMIAMEQLKNAIEALEHGKKPDEVIQENMFADVDTGA